MQPPILWQIVTFTLLLHSLVITGFLLPSPAHAKRQVEQFNLPQPPSYKHYELRVEASSRRAEAGKPVILKAILSPNIAADEVEYQFLINGSPIKEPGMHKVYIFEDTGTYKVSAVARLGGSYLLNSPPIIIHVIDAWIEPEAAIAPAMLMVKPGQDAIFNSLSETDPQSRQWLYWSASNGHRGRGDRFIIKTDKMEVGKYAIELLVRDDRNRESVAHATLIINDPDEDIETLSLETTDNSPIEGNAAATIDLHLHASHTHRLQNMQIVFWIQNAQPGADTELQLDTGDGIQTPWSKKLRYGHRYERLGVYTARITARMPNGTQQSNTVTVYVWPLWLPVILLILGLLLAGIPFFRRHQRQQQQPDPIRYQHLADPGHHQLILPSATETPAITIHKSSDAGRQTLTRKRENHDQ